MALVLSGAIPLVVMGSAGWPQGIGALGSAVQGYDSGASPDVVTVVAVSKTNQFVGAIGGGSSLFVGLLNGTVLKMNPVSGQTIGRLDLPDGNSAAHLTYFNGALYVGTEWLQGAKDKAPFHVYKIEPKTMRILGQLAMDSHFANGLLLAFNGFLWAADGGCTLYQVNPTTLHVEAKVYGVAEDELAFDGTYYWAECRNVVNVLKPVNGLLETVTSGALAYPNRPRGFFTIGAGVYTSGSLDFALYSMSFLRGGVVFKSSGSLGDQSYPTRDTLSHGGMFFAYQTGPGADTLQMPARIHVYGADLRLNDIIRLPGPALSADASQHSLFTLDDRLYFVTGSSVGYLNLSSGYAHSTTVSNPQSPAFTRMIFLPSFDWRH